jgi:hypothetical protein
MLNKRTKTTPANSTTTIQRPIATIKSLPIDVVIMIVELLSFKNALNLCKYLKFPYQVAIQYFDVTQDNLAHINLKPKYLKFLLKNNGFKIQADSYAKTYLALCSSDIEFGKSYIEELKVDLNEALLMAVWGGFTDAVKLFLSDSRVDPSAWDYATLRNAAEKGHLKIMRLLLADPRVIPSAERMDEALYCAEQGGHSEIVNLLQSYMRIMNFDL